MSTHPLPQTTRRARKPQADLPSPRSRPDDPIGDPIVHIVEDDAIMRETVSALLANAGLPARTWNSAEAFLDAVEPAWPICLLTDMRLPGLNGLDLFEALRGRGVPAVTVIMTGAADVPMAVAAMKSGVMDLIEKPFAAAIVVETMAAALQRTRDLVDAQRLRADIEKRYAALTEREREILNLLVEGHPNKTVARRLAISVRTAEHHHANILRKMNAQTTLQLLRIVLNRSAAPGVVQKD